MCVSKCRFVERMLKSKQVFLIFFLFLFHRQMPGSKSASRSAAWLWYDKDANGPVRHETPLLVNNERVRERNVRALARR